MFIDGEFEVPMKLVKVVEIWVYYNNSTCFVHVYLLSSTYVALRKAKAILDERIKNKGVRAGQFASKERVISSPSTSPVPPNPVK